MKEAVIIPIRTPVTDPSKHTIYRPITLTPNIDNIMKRMVTEWLSFVTEETGGPTNYQSGFTKGRNTMDAVVRLESHVRRDQAIKESVFL